MNRSHNQKYRWDNEAVRDYQLKLAIEEWKKEVAISVAQKSKDMGYTIEIISLATELSFEEIEKL